MSRLESSYLLACLALFISAGCNGTQRGETVERISVADTNKTEAMKAAEEVLCRMHFNIDKADPDRGLIRTGPLPGAQFFEFWRSDNVGSLNSLQANLHSIRRTVELNVNRQGKELLIACHARVEQLSLPEHEVSSSARAYSMFSQSTAAMQNLKLHPEQEKRAAWLDLGRDGELETEILERIGNKLAAKRQAAQNTKSL